MTEAEFHSKRKPFYLDTDTLLVRFPTTKHMDCSHAVWFSEIGYPYVHAVRGYYMKDSYIMLYWNDFEIPNVNASLFPYLFEYFPTIKYIGLGCQKGKIGEVWKPKLVITRGEV